MKHEKDIFLPLLGVSFIVLRLCKVILWPWVWVLCPIWATWAVTFFIVLWLQIWKEERKRNAEKQIL